MTYLATAVAALVVGVVIGLAASGSGSDAEPTRFCREAIGIADQGFVHASEFATLSSQVSSNARDAIQAAVRRDAASLMASAEELERINGRMGDVTSQLDGLVDDYHRAKGECRS